MKLVIVESPNKCTTIGHYLGSDFQVMASQGHIRDLSMKGKGGLGIDVAHDFKPDYVISLGKGKIVSQLKNAASKADEVILATDPDREGEAIAWHLAQVLGLDVETTKRLQFHEITRTAIAEAINNPSTLNMNLVNSQETRRMYDRIIGFKLSSLLQRKMSSKSAGRVQSVTLKMICDNDEEIKNFVPEEYWTIEVKVKIGEEVITLNLDKVDDKSLTIHNQEEAEAIKARIGETLKVIELKQTKKSIPSRLPFTTSTMQQEAFAKFRFSTSRTQSIAQKLYEGKVINGEHVGLITYMRTDSTRISPDFFTRHAKPFIIEKFGEEYVGNIKNPKKKGNIQDAHEAIRPTGTHRTPEEVARYVTPDEAKLYRLIYDRAIASMMADKVELQTTAIFETNGLTFKATGSRNLFKGFLAIYGEFEDPDANALPEIEEGGNYHNEEISCEQKFTKPPVRYTEAKVVKLMEEEGIGRPSTYASTIKTLVERGYITSKAGVVTPTETGIRTTYVLNKYFPEIVSSEYTANMENTLDKIEEGEQTELAALNDFYGPFMVKYEDVQEKMYKDPDQETGELCPICGSPLVIKKSRYGSFVACSNYPTCHYIQKEKKEVVITEEICPQCGKNLVERTDKKGNKFLACSGFPKCRYIKGSEEKQEKIIKYTEKDYVKECPKCKKGHLVVKHGKKVDFLGCTNFPKCRYHEWLNKKEKKDKEVE
ncbi:MAG: type I DNA topoisomerase [Bacilli bacterium]|nr:type I DNA topoisomerase [Bacilli bacterium]